MRRDLIRLALSLASPVISAALLQAQTQSSPAPSLPPAYTLHANTRLVLTDVTVTDRNGDPVHGLPRSAFHITEGKRDEDIASFEEHRGLPDAPVAAVANVPAENGVYNNEFLLHAPPVLNVLVIDITNIAIEDQMYLNFEITQFLNNLPPGQMLAIYGRSGPASVLLQNFTADRNLLVAALHREIPRFPPRGPEYLSDVATLEQIARYLGDLPGRKNVLWFTGGSTLFLRPDASPFQDTASLRRVYDELEANRIAVYPIDARGLTVSSARGMFEQHALMNDVAEATGGRAFYNNNGLRQIAAKVTTTGADFYTLTYIPHNYEEDKKWHKVRITLDGPAYTLSYRRGYFADGVNTSPERGTGSVAVLAANGSTSSAQIGSRTSPIVFRARILPMPGDSAAAGVSSQETKPPRKPKKGAMPYSVHYTIPADSLTVASAGGRAAIQVLLAAFAFNQDGSVVDRHLQRVTVNVNEANLRRDPHGEVPLDQQLQLVKGDMYIVLAILDEASGRSGNLQVAMRIAAPPKS